MSVGGARILVEFAFAPPGATAGRQYRTAWRNMRRATARSNEDETRSANKYVLHRLF